MPKPCTHSNPELQESLASFAGSTHACASWFVRMKTTSEVYWDWSWAFHHTTALCVLLQTILTLSLKHRKELLGLARTQSPVVRGSYLESTLPCLEDSILVPSSPTRRLSDVRYVSMTFRNLVDDYRSTLLSPIPCSIIALAARIAPSTTAEEYTTILQEAVSKEISAAINRFRGAKLDFRCIFHSDLHCREIPFTDRMSPNPEVASDTYQTFCRLRLELSGMLVFPSGGRKTVGSIVTHNFWDAYALSGATFKHDSPDADANQVSPLDCLRLYEETGGYVPGPVEMRTAWKYNQIAPRVYYARGGDVIAVSQFLQPIVNRMIDAFPETHRKNRFAPPRDVLDPTDVEVIYDYTSFTSTIDDVVEFVRHLAIFFRGVRVVLVDVREGLKLVDLGDLLDAYNQTCNDYADFDPTRVVPSDPDLPPIIQHTCGMLGVEGNIFMATLLHGIHLRFIAGLNRSRCVGDDARLHYATFDGTLPADERRVLGWNLSGIGLSNDEKLGVFESGVDPVMQAFRYVKRPIQRDSDIMIEGVLFDVPSLIPLFRLADSFHTILPTSAHPCRRTFQAILRMFRVMKLHNISENSDKEGMKILASHIHHITDELRRQDPTGEHAPLARSGLPVGYRLPPVKLWGVIEYEEWVMESIGLDQVVRFLKRGGGDGEDTMCDGRLGSSMIKETSTGRSFLVKMGYLEKEELFDEVTLREIGTDEMRDYLDGEYRAVCRYTVVKNIPSWYTQIPRTL